MYVHVNGVRKYVVLTYIKFIAGFMIVATACRVDEEVCRVFLLNVILGHLKRGHEL